MADSKICLIGDIVVDVTLKNEREEVKLRLGGIVHAARGLWAMSIPFSVGYFAPTYLDEQIDQYLTNLGCQDVIKLGDISGAPYVFLIDDVKEVGDQGYEFLLRDEIKVSYDDQAINKIFNSNHEHYLLISGNYQQEMLINGLNGLIHIDVANNIDNISFFSGLNKKLSTIFVSTSSSIFREFFKNEFQSFCAIFEDFTSQIILKENRGGSRGYDFNKKEKFSTSSQTVPIVHSVGVGDVFDACFVSNYLSLTGSNALTLSSWIACEYALTTFPDDFKTGVERVLKSDLNQLSGLRGVCLPWEDRTRINIYIAAPDFSFVDVKPIDKLVTSLRYHNFNPRRPILENGEMEQNANKSRKQELFKKDMMLLDQCAILIAVLLYNDPGTLIEIGIAASKGMPTIVYDPYEIAENCMLTELPSLVSFDLDKIVSEVFIASSKIGLNAN